MEAERIEAYKILGDRLDNYMQKFDQGAKGFYYKFSRADKHFKLMTVVKEAAEKVMKAKEPYPLFTYDEFVNAFERPINGKCAATTVVPSWGDGGLAEKFAMVEKLDQWDCYRYRVFETVVPLRNMIWRVQ